MQIPLVMTIIGKDRPGMVDAVARIVVEQGGNWLESRMCHLGGQFAGILRVTAPADREHALVEALNLLRSQGMSVVVHTGIDTPPPAGQLAEVEIVGQDRPGIVRQISGALASQGVNVEELHSECSSAPMSGEVLFKAQIRIQIPAGCNTTELQRELEKIASDLMVDIQFQTL